MKPTIKYISQEELEEQASSAVHKLIGDEITSSITEPLKIDFELRRLLKISYILGFRAAFTPGKISIPGFSHEK